VGVGVGVGGSAGGPHSQVSALRLVRGRGEHWWESMGADAEMSRARLPQEQCSDSDSDGGTGKDNVAGAGAADGLVRTRARRTSRQGAENKELGRG
jgi:hypothetical protein